MRTVRSIIGFLLVSTTAPAQITSLGYLEMTAHGSNSHSLSTRPGESFQVDLHLDCCFTSVASFWYRLTASNPNAFEITGITGISPWQSNGPLGPLDATNQYLVRHTPLFGPLDPPGKYAVATLSFAIPPNATPGQYHLNTLGADTVYDSWTGLGFFWLPASDPVVVTIVPEPASVLCLMFGIMALKRKLSRSLS